MAYDFVEVSIQVASPDGGSVLAGELTLYPSDFIWDNNTKQIVVVQPVPLIANTGGFTGNVRTVELLAMDNAGLSTNWAWLLVAGIPGLPSPVPPRKLTVDFANGAQQNLTDLLATSTTV